MLKIPEMLIDREILKKKLAKWKFISLLLIFILFLTIFKDDSSSTGKHIEDFIARIKIEDTIVEDHEKIKKLGNIAKNEKIKAVIIHINSPGGTVVGGEDMYNAISKISEIKPVVTIMGTVATSAAYLVACASDHIFARNGTVTGSIGVISYMPEFSDLAKKLGIEIKTYRSGKFKALPSPFEKSDEEVNKVNMEVIMDNYYSFIDMIASKRKNLNKEQLFTLSDGRIFSGKQAVSLGLIDAIGDEEMAIKWLETNKKISNNLKVHNIDLIDKRDKFAKFIPQFESLYYKFTNLVTFFLEGSPTIWHPNM